MLSNLPKIIGDFAQNFINYGDPLAIDKYWWCTLVPFSFALIGEPALKSFLSFLGIVTDTNSDFALKIGKLPSIKNEEISINSLEDK